jgi:hypothetical protein
MHAPPFSHSLRRRLLSCTVNESIPNDMDGERQEGSEVKEENKKQ